MQSYSSAVDGKTLIRVGGGHGSKAKTLLSNGASPATKSDLGLSTTSSRRPSLTSSSSSSSTISIGDMPPPRVRSTSGSVTVKTATPQKKMTSIIDIKSGVVTTSFATADHAPTSAAALASSPTASSSPIINYGTLTSRDDVTTTSPASKTFAKSTSVLLMSTTILETSREDEEKFVPTTSFSPVMTSPAPKMTSSILTTSIPDTPSASLVAVATPPELRNVGVVVAEVHSPPTGVDSQDLRISPDIEERFASVSLPNSVGSSGSKVMTLSESNADETGSLVFADEIDSQISPRSKTVTDRVELPVSGASPEISHPVSDKRLCDLDLKFPSSPPLSNAPSNLPSLSPPLESLITEPHSSGSCTEATKPETGASVITGSESVPPDAPETTSESTFNFIGWGLGNMADKMADRMCHRILIFKDREIVLMFKASCMSEGAGNDVRLRTLMIDIATNCAKRLKKMKDVSLPKLEAEHMDSLPLSDDRPTKQHLEEISRELNENVMINDVAFRFQSTDDDTYIGTYVDGNDAPSAESNCEIGRAGVVVVLKKKSRFAAVESFSDQLCRHILSTRPSSLGRISDLEVRRLSSTKTRPDPDKKQLLLFQDFLSDHSIIVAEAARRSFIRVLDFLLFA